MLTIYRRHVKDCEHGGEGRKYRRCRCPIWVDGFLKGAEIRKALEVRNRVELADSDGDELRRRARRPCG